MLKRGQTHFTDCSFNTHMCTVLGRKSIRQKEHHWTQLGGICSRGGHTLVHIQKVYRINIINLLNMALTSTSSSVPRVIKFIDVHAIWLNLKKVIRAHLCVFNSPSLRQHLKNCSGSLWWKRWVRVSVWDVRQTRICMYYLVLLNGVGEWFMGLVLQLSPSNT